MNAKPVWIEEAPALQSRLRIQYPVESVDDIVRVRVARTQDAAPVVGLHLRNRLPLVDDSATFWEVLSYAVIWLCGLAGIGLCFS
jgi:hypothetical protein